MFGLLYAAAMGIGCLVSGTKCFIQNEQAKERGRNRADNPANAYFDRKGAMRDLATNRFVDYVKDNMTGDICLRYDCSFTLTRNLSKEWRDHYYAELKEHPIDGKTVINDINVKKHAYLSKDDSISPSYYPWNDRYYCTGQWYKDLNTGDLYVARKIEGYDFYMKIITGKLVRLTDDFIMNNRDKEGVFEKAQEILNKYNQSKDDGTWQGKYPSTIKALYCDKFYLNYSEVLCGSSINEKMMMGMSCPHHPVY